MAEVSSDINKRRIYKEMVDTTISELPHDKDFHLFICYVSENVEEVRTIVRNLEEYGIKCCYHERNFTPGQMIIDNMHRAIQRSVGMLIVLSEEFVSSKYCKFEVVEAQHLRITEGYALIPIKVEPCAVPKYIQHISHIDASEDDIGQVHLRIIESIALKVTQDQEKMKNGEYRAFRRKFYKDCKLSTGRYILHISQEDRRALWKDGFEVSNELLDTAETIFNDSKLVIHLNVFNHFLRILTSLAFASLLFFTVVFLAVMLTTSGTTKTELENMPAFFVLVICPVVLFLVYGIVLCYCSVVYNSKACMRLLRQETVLLNNQLWDNVTQHTGSKSKLFIFYHLSKGLVIMRLNLKPCKDYFVRKLETRKDLLLSTDDFTEMTNKAFEVFLRNEINTLMNVPGSEQTRHTMATEGKCPCLLVQERVFKED